MPRETTCPVCQAYIPLDRTDKVGSLVYCSYCGSQLRITAEAAEEGRDIIVEEDPEAEE
jgi:predicted amidophosphoribosyltransferase